MSDICYQYYHHSGQGRSGRKAANPLKCKESGWTRYSKKVFREGGLAVTSLLFSIFTLTTLESKTINRLADQNADRGQSGSGLIFLAGSKMGERWRARERRTDGMECNGLAGWRLGIVTGARGLWLLTLGLFL